MIDQLIKALKGVLPDSAWDFIFDQFQPHKVRFSKDSYRAVRVTPRFMLVEVPVERQMPGKPEVPLSNEEIERLIRQFMGGKQA